MPFKIDISLPRPRFPYLRPSIKLIKRHHSRRRPKNEPDPETQAADMNNMDPDCAICSHPATAQCECEALALDKAVSQAETRMMASVFTEIRYATPPDTREMQGEDGQVLTMDADPGSAPTPKIISSNTSPCSPSAAKPCTPKR